MLEKLWNDIGFLSKYNYLIKNNLLIVSRDNIYLIFHKNNDTTTQIRIEKNYNLVNMWSGESGIDYKIHVEVNSKVEISEDYKIELTYKLITPYLRDIRLESIGI